MGFTALVQLACLIHYHISLREQGGNYSGDHLVDIPQRS
jgi:hypothetical protein